MKITTSAFQKKKNKESREIIFDIKNVQITVKKKNDLNAEMQRFFMQFNRVSA